MRSQLENIMKSKVMKKTTQLTIKKVLKCTFEQGENQYQVRYKISHLILEHVVNIYFQIIYFSTFLPYFTVCLSVIYFHLTHYLNVLVIKL